MKYQRGRINEGLAVIGVSFIIVLLFVGIFLLGSPFTTAKIIDTCKVVGQFQHEKTIVKCQVIEPGVK